jgi:hypothetical protein
LRKKAVGKRKRAIFKPQVGGDYEIRVENGSGGWNCFAGNEGKIR